MMTTSTWIVLGIGIAAFGTFAGVGYSAMGANPPHVVSKWVPRMWFFLAITSAIATVVYILANLNPPIEKWPWVVVIIGTIGLLVYIFWPLFTKKYGRRTLKKEGSKMLIGLGIFIIIAGMVGGSFLIWSQLESPSDKVANFIEQANKMEGNILEKDLDVNIDFTEGVPDISSGAMVIITHVIITNESDSAKSIQANVNWRILINGTHNMIIPLWQPPDNNILDFKNKIEQENGRSFGDYLKSPLNLEAQKSISGFMLFSISLQGLVDFGKQLPPFSHEIGSKLPDSALYFEWTDKITKQEFRKQIVPSMGVLIPPEQGFKVLQPLDKPITIQGNDSYSVPIK